MFWLNFIGVFVFAVSGGLAGVRRHFDLFGILVLALVTALGGGVIRDVLLGRTPPANLTDVPAIATALGAGLLTFWFAGPLERLTRAMLVADAAGLATFAVAGTLTAIDGGHPGLPAVCVGVITAVGGGVLRELFSGSVPVIFSRDLYAVPALVGAVLTDLSARLQHDDRLVEWLVVGLVFALRLLALRFHWQLPRPRRLDPV